MTSFHPPVTSKLEGHIMRAPSPPVACDWLEVQGGRTDDSDWTANAGCSRSCFRARPRLFMATPHVVMSILGNVGGAKSTEGLDSHIRLKGAWSCGRAGLEP